MKKSFIFVAILVVFSSFVFAESTGEVIAIPIPICPWDADGNGLVELVDRDYVSAHFSCFVGIGNADCDRCDVDRNGIVNPGDRGHISANIGTNCTFVELPNNPPQPILQVTKNEPLVKRQILENTILRKITKTFGKIGRR